MKILVIGCGSIGQRHLRNLRALGEMELYAYDQMPERLEQILQVHKFVVRSSGKRLNDIV